MLDYMSDYILILVTHLIAVTVVLTLHEWAHAFVAVRCGDNTPKYYGRLSLNPLKHFDALGLVLFAVAGFGWAKPVPIQPSNFKHYKTGLVLTSLAGILINYLCAIFFYPLMILARSHLAGTNLFFEALFRLISALYEFSLSFCIFNLIPLPPLDGFRYIEATNETHGRFFRFLRDYGRYILLALILESFLCRRISVLSSFDLLGIVFKYASQLFAAPIEMIWIAIAGLH